MTEQFPHSVGLWRNEKHQYWWADDVTVGPLPSITTVIKAVDKSGPLIGWAKKITAEAAVRNLDLIAKMKEEGGEQAGIDFLKKLADHKRDKAADLGTRVHALAEAIAHKQAVQVTDDERPYVEAYARWQYEWQPQFFAAEYMVCSLKHGYAGTGDLVTGMRGARWRLDIKTSTGVYAETGMQLAAAHWADFCGRPNDAKKYAIPKAEKQGVLHLRSDGSYAVVPYRVTQDTFQRFLAAKAVWEWLEGDAKQMVGAPLPDIEEAAA